MASNNSPTSWFQGYNFVSSNPYWPPGSFTYPDNSSWMPGEYNGTTIRTTEAVIP